MSLRLPLIFLTAVLLAACATPGGNETVETAPEPVEPPAKLEGSWERDYARDDDVNATLQRAYNVLAKSLADQQRPGVPNRTGLSGNEARSLVALARLVELITRPDVLRVTSENGVMQVHRRDDFSLTCAFAGGSSQVTGGTLGAERCTVDNGDLLECCGCGHNRAVHACIPWIRSLRC